jgi:hypothetical protein
MVGSYLFVQAKSKGVSKGVSELHHSTSARSIGVDVSRSRLPSQLAHLRIRKRSSDKRVGQGRLPNGTEAENGDLAVDERRILPFVHIGCCGL